MTSDFARYLHLHRVRTLIQILTPWLEAGLPLDPAAYLRRFRDCPGSAHLAYGDERRAAGRCLPLAIEDASFDRMSDDQMRDVDSDVRLCFRRYYGALLQEWREFPQ